MSSLGLLCRVQKIAIIIVVLSLAGCIPQTTVPIETIHYDLRNKKKSRTLFVFLPGRGDSVKVFQREGIIEAVRERGFPVDMMAVNAHLGYYIKGMFFPRMKEDVIKPAKAAGYEEIWMIGDSLGGFGSLSYAREYADDITGAVLLGPFPGEETLINEIKQAGGIHRWNPQKIAFNTEEGQVKLNLLWLRDLARERAATGNGENNQHIPVIYLGYGKDDRFANGQALFASLLPQDHILVIDGGHDWSTWKKLWIMFLDKHFFKAEKHSEAKE